MGLGTLPASLEGESILESIQETIIISDNDYRIVWMNATAVHVLSPLLKLYGVDHPEKAIGQSMDFFHHSPDKSREIMNNYSEGHRTRITIKGQYTGETIINPIKDSDGHVLGHLVMLVDVTEQAIEEELKQEMIEVLSTPHLKIWDGIIAIPIAGPLTDDRAKQVMETILSLVVKEKADYILLNVSALTAIDETTNFHLFQLHGALKLMGVSTFFVGMTPALAATLVNQHERCTTFQDA
ncbi:anti-anti-sigma regulatory factor [Bacillus ectoiniformans]|uniref:STAS domain-containing protein n=1 Tax=Bacillus ectoiniformans TaxID=1494429 RepID=UPI00195C94F2|nr:STAS domain-containing protein [Bacillus ectoiniformans]MBM7647891.1 anti-anti-sigma regulatory factor [Bacillus ectoiniformans]